MVIAWIDRSRWEEKHGNVRLIWIDQKTSKVEKKRKNRKKRVFGITVQRKCFAEIFKNRLKHNEVLQNSRSGETAIF